MSQRLKDSREINIFIRTYHLFPRDMEIWFDKGEFSRAENDFMKNEFHIILIICTIYTNRSLYIDRTKTRMVEML